MLSMYCVHPISGCSADDVYEYYEDIYKVFSKYYKVYIPMFGKSSLRTETKFKAEGYKDNPITSNHAIFERDRWMVKMADVVFANLTNATNISIGSVMELAWASDDRKHVVLAMGDNNIHRHAFVLEAADIIYNNEKDAIDYLITLGKREI